MTPPSADRKQQLCSCLTLKLARPKVDIDSHVTRLAFNDRHRAKDRAVSGGKHSLIAVVCYMQRNTKQGSMTSSLNFLTSIKAKLLTSRPV